MKYKILDILNDQTGMPYKHGIGGKTVNQLYDLFLEYRYEQHEEREWDFSEPPSKVDIDRIHAELEQMPTLSMGYLASLEKNAPTVFKRYCEKYKPID